MVNSNKIRIYDLARDKTPKDLDDKVQKKIQAEITRQVIHLGTKFGQNPKTASSSIDASVVDTILAEMNIEEIIEEASGSKKASTTKASPTRVKKTSPTTKTEEAEEEPPKRKIKIVRRLTPPSASVEEGINQNDTDPNLEKPPEENTETVNEIETAPKEEIQEAGTDNRSNLGKQEHVQEMLESINKPSPAKTATPSRSINQLQSVKSIPLKPSGGGSSQPYRVARPTIVQGTGRKKKRPSLDELKARRARPSKKTYEQDDTPKEVTITEAMTVREVAHKLEIPETAIITYFFMKRIIKTVNETLEKDLIVEFAEAHNFVVNTTEDKSHIGRELRSALKQDETAGQLISRPPVVTIMGHVDHGKTTLLDTIRSNKTKITEGESGGITQHIGAYQVTTVDYDGNERHVTFLDTPGHEAFTAMRQRGANATDMVILVVAADDGIMPQTIESIKHIREAKVPFLVAVNKIDKVGANSDKVLGQLAEYDIVVEQYGGPVVCSMISALQGTNLDDLLEKIILVADAELSEEIRSNPHRLAIGTIVEAELSRSQGALATVLVQNGTLRRGDHISAGAVSGRVKAMFNDVGDRIDEAGPSTPVKILGLAGVPKAGDTMQAHKSAQEAKTLAQAEAYKELEGKRFRGLSTFASDIREGQAKEFQVIIKADVQGSAEAVASELNKLSTDEVLVKPIVVDSGSITVKDVQMAIDTNAMVIGFHVGADAQTAKLAKAKDIKLKTYEVIYKLTEDVRRLVLGLHDPDIEEVKMGAAEVRQLFTIGKSKKVAGCMVVEGKVIKKEVARVMREGVQIYEGKVDYLRRFKDDAKEVREGTECGLSFEKYNDLQEGDVIECWTIKEVARTEV